MLRGLPGNFVARLQTDHVGTQTTDGFRVKKRGMLGAFILDYNKIKLLGRWRLDAMMVYLQTSVCPLMQNFVNVMVNNGEYAQIPADIGGEATGKA